MSAGGHRGAEAIPHPLTVVEILVARLVRRTLCELRGRGHHLGEALV